MLESSGGIDVDYVASLARIELSAEEKQALSSDMERIVSYVDLLAEKDLPDVLPTAHALPVCNIWREDVPGIPPGREPMLQNAPRRIGEDGGLVMVPQVLPGDEEGA